LGNRLGNQSRHQAGFIARRDALQQGNSPPVRDSPEATLMQTSSHQLSFEEREQSALLDLSIHIRETDVCAFTFAEFGIQIPYNTAEGSKSKLVLGNQVFRWHSDRLSGGLQKINGSAGNGFYDFYYDLDSIRQVFRLDPINCRPVERYFNGDSHEKWQ
jgi:hypothetical protein